ncbi:unnamed protein product [Paramecium primaurelia]|uniref:Guanylate cyclase domain-containing protein n=1 Tax=Paramecium primaurelia TaxID=5886 RepID=A0A8S1P3V9_PARPR|nr:unnamed protein product [Paramecium primaurelia]
MIGQISLFNKTINPKIQQNTYQLIIFQNNLYQIIKKRPQYYLLLQKVEPEQVVNILRNLFIGFDNECLTSNIYKLCTIRDAFGIVDIMQRNAAQEAKNVFELGFGMVEIIRNARQIIGFDGLDMRRGIYTGKVIAGILETKIVRYDVYSADVMISKKMKSNGEKGRVQVSQETKTSRSPISSCVQFSFQQIDQFESINRQINGYFVEPQKNDSGFDDSNQSSEREQFKTFI